MLQTINSNRLAVFSIRISGVITSQTLLKLSRHLSRFSIHKPAALAVVVNSPGGSAVSSHLIAQRLKAYGDREKVPLYGFAEGVAASGGYMVLTACREIYVTEGSVVGSIGARFDFYGIKNLAQEHGIERRAWASSPNDLSLKLDILSDLKPETKDWVNSILKDTHQDFQAEVMAARGSRLQTAKPSDPSLNGEVYIGQKAIDVGCEICSLADKLGNANSILKDMFPRLKVVDLSRPRCWEAVKERISISR